MLQTADRGAEILAAFLQRKFLLIDLLVLTLYGEALPPVSDFGILLMLMSIAPFKPPKCIPLCVGGGEERRQGAACSWVDVPF